MKKRALGEGPQEAKPTIKQKCCDNAWEKDLQRDGLGEGPGLTDLMKRDWCSGRLSSVQVQEYCAGAVRQGCTASEAVGMGSVGNEQDS